MRVVAILICRFKDKIEDVIRNYAGITKWQC